MDSTSLGYLPAHGLRILYAWLVEEEEIDASPMARLSRPWCPAGSRDARTPARARVRAPV